MIDQDSRPEKLKVTTYQLRKLQRRVRTSFRRIEELRMDLALGGLPGLCSMARDAKDALDRLDTALEAHVHGI